MTDPQFTIAVLVLIQQDHNFLLIQESKEQCRNKWFLPGGRAAAGESILDAAAREVREETGILAELTGLLYVDQLVGAAGNTNRIRFVFSGKAVSGTPKQAEDEHSIRAGWFSESEINSLDLRSPFVGKVLKVHRENPVPLPISKVHVLTFEELLLERP